MKRGIVRLAAALQFQLGTVTMRFGQVCAKRVGGQARDEDCDRCGHQHGDRHSKPACKPEAEHPGDHDRQNDCWLSGHGMHGRETNLEKNTRKHGVGEGSGNRRNEPTQRPYLPTGDDQGCGCDQTADRGWITARLRAR